MNKILWLAVIVLSMEALFFGNGIALVAGLIMAALGIVLEAKQQ